MRIKVLQGVLISIAGFSALVASGRTIPEDSVALLNRVKTRIAEHMAHLPNYTCHQTMERFIRNGTDVRHLDTIELEVAFVGQRELFSRPGTDSFGEQPIEKLVSSGTFASNALGSHVDAVFSLDAVNFKFVETGKKDGRKTYRFDMRVPVETSPILVRRAGAQGMAGYEGSVWVDIETLDLVRVDIKANRIPAHVGVRQIQESLHYKNLIIGKSEFNLPVRSELSAFDEMGNVSVNMIKLGGCREFAGESVVKYGPQSQGTASRERQDQ